MTERLTVDVGGRGLVGGKVCAAGAVARRRRGGGGGAQWVAGPDAGHADRLQ